MTLPALRREITLLSVLAAAALTAGPSIGRAGDPPVHRIAPAGRAAAAPAAASAPTSHYALDAISVEGCASLPFPPHRRELFVREHRAVDPSARFWMLDRPVAYEDLVSSVGYRLGSGTLRVKSELSDDLSEERVSLAVERPIEAQLLQVYLPGVALPCSRRIRYAVQAGDARPPIELSAAVSFDVALHHATELLYDARFADAEARLREAMSLRPDDPGPYWMMARLRYLELETALVERSGLLDAGALAARAEGYADAEHWADLAVERAPLQPEGYLWQAVSRGRRITSQGPMRSALQGVAAGRGPRWLRETLERAVALAETYRFFGNSTRADALYALAQFERLAPDTWYMVALGTHGDIDRSVTLLREAVALQPARIEYHKELAVSLRCRDGEGDHAAAALQLQQVLELPPVTPIDALDHAHARALQSASPEQACSYSRDSFAVEPAR